MTIDINGPCPKFFTEDEWTLFKKVAMELMEKAGINNGERKCETCGADISYLNAKSRFCNKCADARTKAKIELRTLRIKAKRLMDKMGKEKDKGEK